MLAYLFTTINWGDFGQVGRLRQFNFQHLCIVFVQRFLDEMFLIAKFSYQSLCHGNLIVKFFVQRQKIDFDQFSEVAPLSKVAPFDDM